MLKILGDTKSNVVKVIEKLIVLSHRINLTINEKKKQVSNNDSAFNK
jgi:hypothetical protein